MPSEKLIHEREQAVTQRQPTATHIQPTTETHTLDNAMLASRTPQQLRTPQQISSLQRTIGNRKVSRLLHRTSSDAVQRDVDSASIDTDTAKSSLEKHVGLKAQQQQLVAKEKHGQGMAEALVREGRTDAFKDQKAGPDEQKGISDSLRRLVEFTRFDDAALISVLANAQNGGLSDAQKWDVIKVNSDFMRYIEPGMIINKIIPDSSVESIVKDKKISQFGNGVLGSVAHKMNYDQGLTGEESVSNFGLDYGGYTGTNKTTGKRELIDQKDWGLSSYVKKTGQEQSGREKIAAVKNVFYVQLQVPNQDIPNMKVPIHSNIRDFAKEKKSEVEAVLGNTEALKSLVQNLGGKDTKEVVMMLMNKLKTLNKFLAVAFFTTKMEVTKDLDGNKNEDNPLTNLGITKPGARLQNKFGTINQEYHLSKPVQLPAGSGLFLKDSTGKDTQVGTFAEVMDRKKFAKTLTWIDLNTALIAQALQENDTFRKS